MLIEQEVPKYKKPTDSNISKSNRKSKHKHQYEECLLQYNFAYNDYTNNRTNTSTHLGSYCIICGKIGDRFKEDKSIVKDYEHTDDTPIGKCYQIMTSEELYGRYHNKLPVFFVENYWKDGYVNLEQNDK